MTEKYQGLDNGIILLTPFYNQQRGNTVTALRLLEGYRGNGIKTELVSLDDKLWTSKIKNLLNAGEYKILHGFNARYMTRVFKDMPELVNLPFLITLTGTDINFDLKKDKRDDFAFMFDLASFIVVFQQYFADLLIKNFSHIAEKIQVIPQGVKIPCLTGKTRRDIGWDEDEVVFMLPSGIRPVKNIMLAVNALKEVYLSYPQARLAILGPVIDEDYGRKVLEHIKKHEWIRYLGEIEHEKIGDYLVLSDVVINCSLAEGQPQAALEAMGLEKPAILTAVPGNLGVIENGKEGIYVKNADELAAAARFLIENIEVRKMMGKEAEKLVRTKYRPELEIEGYIRLVQQIIKD